MKLKRNEDFICVRPSNWDSLDENHFEGIQRMEEVTNIEDLNIWTQYLNQ
jgi:hypothetical protein